MKRKVRRFFLLKREVSSSPSPLSCLTARRQGNRRARDRGSAARAASSSSVVSKLARISTISAEEQRHHHLRRGVHTALNFFAPKQHARRRHAHWRQARRRHARRHQRGISAARSTAARSTACGTLDGGMRFFGILLGVEDLLAFDRRSGRRRLLNGGTLDGRGTAADGRWS